MPDDPRLAALLAAICRAPGEDDARLVLADFLDERGDPLGALVREDVAEVAGAARHGRPTLPGTPGRLARHRSAVARWCALVPELAGTKARDPRWKIVRGLPGHAAVAWKELAGALARWDDRAPIEHLDVSGDVDDRGLAALLAAPILPRLRSLSLRDCAIGDDALLAIAAADLASLRWLDLAKNRFGERGAEALVASSALPRLVWAGFDGCAVDPTERAWAENELGLWDVARTQGVAVHETRDVVETEQSPFAEDLERRLGARTWTKVLWRRPRERAHRHCHWDLRDVVADDDASNGAVFLGGELLRVHAARARWSGRGRSGATFAGARVEGCTFDDADLHHLAATRATIVATRFVRARLADTSFDHARVERCDFSGADLSRASFDGAEVKDSSFRGATLACPDALFRTTNRTNAARFVRCDFRDADFSARELVGTTFVDCAFAGAHGRPEIFERVAVERPDLSPDADGSRIAGLDAVRAMLR